MSCWSIVAAMLSRDRNCLPKSRVNQGLRFLPCLDKGNCAFGWMLPLADAGTDGVCYCLQGLVVALAIPASQGLWATAEDVFSLLAELAHRRVCQAPGKQISGAWEDIIHRLDQELEMMWLHPPQIGPGDLAASYMLPLGPSTLFAHAHHSAEASLFHLCTNLLLDQLPPFLPSGSAVARLWVATQPSPTCTVLHGTNQGVVPQPRFYSLHCVLGMPLPSCSDLHTCWRYFPINWISVEQDFSGLGELKLLCHTAERKLELGPVPKQSNTAEALWQAQPPVQVLADLPLKALHGRNCDFIHQ